MFKTDFSFYKGDDKPLGYINCLQDKSFFLIFEVEEGLTDEDGEKIITKIKALLSQVTLNNLSGLEKFVSESIKQLNPPANFSLACGYLADEIVYLKTEGNAQICILRNGKLTPIIDGGNSASGYVADDDLFIFSAQNFFAIWEKEQKIRESFTRKNPQDIIRNLYCAVNFFLVRFSQEYAQPADENIESNREIETDRKTALTNLSKLGNFSALLRDRFRFYTQASHKKKTYTFIILIVIFLLFIWSVGFGYQRRNNDRELKKIQTAKELILQKLSQAEDVAFLNLARSLLLIDEAKSELGNLKRQVGKDNAYRIEEIAKLIQSKEDSITKKEEKKHEEFFDLTVDSKDASGKRIYLSGDKIAVLDNKLGKIYTLSLSKKSLDKVQSTKIKSAKIVAGYANDVFFLSAGDGIFKISSDNKEQKVVDWDKDWGEIVDMWIYNGNIYLLDSGRDEIYKYLVSEGGYSSKNSYFQKGESVSLKGANSLSIDSSVYVGFAGQVIKYTGGIRDQFKTSFPDDNLNINKIFTNKDTEKVYAWDKKGGSLFVLGKNGVYERQIKSNIFKNGDDFIVYSDNSYILLGSKIYKINLD